MKKHSKLVLLFLFSVFLLIVIYLNISSSKQQNHHYPEVHSPPPTKDIFEFLAYNFAILQVPKLYDFATEMEVYKYFLTLFNMSDFHSTRTEEEFLERLSARVSELSGGNVQVKSINKNDVLDEIKDFTFSNSLREIFFTVSLKKNPSLKYPILYVQISPASNGFIAYQKTP